MNGNVSMMFNIHKMKYVDMNEFFKFDIKEKKTIYFNIDLDYLMGKYLYTIDFYNTKDMKITEEMTKDFLTEFLNLIAHYKNYFYKYCDCVCFFYIFLNKKRYDKNKELDKMLKRITRLISMIPRLYICYYENEDQGFFLKYNLIRTILITKGNKEKNIFLEIGKSDKNELIYKLTKNYNIFKFDDYKIYLYGFENFKEDYMPDIEFMYINDILNLMSVYIILDEIKINKKVRLNDIILKYIKENRDKDFNSISTKLLILKMFSRLKSLEKKLKTLEYNLNSPLYSQMIQIIMENWKHIIKDNSIYNINEILHIPVEKRINIETLMKY